MKVHRRIVLTDAAIGAGLVTAAWYLYYLLGVGGMVDYLREGLLLEYVTGPAIHVEMLVSGLGLGVILALVSHVTEGTSLCLTEIVLRYGAEIYQYVGDEVVLTWPARRPDSGARSLHAFFAFRRKLRRKAGWYRDTFGVAPEFRAGIECGEVTAAEVGDIKRDIAFHGEALNTAARLLELCGEFEEPVLISGHVRDTIASDRSLAAELRGELVLRGQSQPVPIYGVESAAS